MALSTRTLIKKKDWAELIRSLDEGETVLPTKIAPMDYNSIRTTIYRENGYNQPFVYNTIINGAELTIIKKRRNSNAESSQ